MKLSWRLPVFLLLVAMQSALALAQDQLRWYPRASLLEDRQEIYADVADGRVYVAGGIAADGQTLASVERYDANSNSWVRLRPLPAARHHTAVAAVGKEVFAIGGFNGSWSAWQAKDDVFRYDIATDAWSPGPPLPVPRGEHVSAVVGRHIFVIGGRIRKTPGAKSFFDHIDTNLNTRLDTATNAWTAVAPMPTARNSHGAAVIDGKIYVVGGRRTIIDGNGGVTIENLAVLEVYDPETDTWTTRAPMPSAQGGLAAVAYSGKLYVFGGEEFSPQHKVFSNAWIYDPKGDRWAALPELPTPRHGLAAAVVAGKIYVFGGADRVGFGAVSTNEALAPK